MVISCDLVVRTCVYMCLAEIGAKEVERKGRFVALKMMKPQSEKGRSAAAGTSRRLSQ